LIFGNALSLSHPLCRQRCHPLFRQQIRPLFRQRCRQRCHPLFRQRCHPLFHRRCQQQAQRFTSTDLRAVMTPSTRTGCRQRTALHRANGCARTRSYAQATAVTPRSKMQGTRGPRTPDSMGITTTTATRGSSSAPQLGATRVVGTTTACGTETH